MEIAERIGLPCVVSSAVESSVGLAAGLALAGALPELPYACGLGTTSLLADDPVAEPYVPVRGKLPVPDRAPALVGNDQRASPDRVAWWLDRLTRVLRRVDDAVR